MASPAKSCRSSVLERAQEWRVMGESVVESLGDFFTGVESREQALGLRLRDLEERERKLQELQEGRSVELNLREEKLDVLLKSVHEHIERLESSQSEVEGLKWKECEKLKEIEERERELDAAGKSLEKRLNEVEMRENELEAFHRRRVEELALKEEGLCKKMQHCVDEVKLACNCFMERLETALAGLDRKKAMIDERFNEVEYRETIAHESITAKLNEADSIRKSLERKFKELEHFEMELNSSQLEKPDSKEETSEAERRRKVVRFKEQGLNQTISLDKTTLYNFVNDPKKVLELKDSELYRTLSRSSDPAKLVLDAVQGFYELRSGEPHSRRATIILLSQLTKISPKIQPCVSVAATVFAFRWKLKLCATSADPMKVLGFLHLLAAFNLSARFNKDEMFGFLKAVGQHEQTPGLFRALGLAERVPGYIQDLINGKEFLPASTYIHEFQLQNMWKQSSILNSFITNARARKRPNTSDSEAPLNTSASEISDLRIAIQHIEKYGLESAYSPHALRARILQLEASQGSLRPANPSSSAADDDAKRDTRSKESWLRRKEQGRKSCKDAARKSASPARECLASSSQQSGFRARVNQAPRPHPSSDSPYKKRKPNL